MMRLQRVGRRNDPSFRIVVTDKRTGPKSDKHIDRLGSYNPKMNQVQLDADKAKEWIAKGVQPSDIVHNILVSQKVIDGKKVNVLPKKSPVVDEEAVKRAEEEAAAKVEAEKAEEESSTEDVSEEETLVESAGESTESEAVVEVAKPAVEKETETGDASAEEETEKTT